MQLEKITWEWLGGFVDGEGSFSVIVYARKDTGLLDIRPCLEINNTDLNLMDSIAKFLGTKCYPLRSRHKNRALQAHIMVKYNRLLEILRNLYPFLKSMRKRKATRYTWIMQYFRSLRPQRKAPLASVELLAKLTGMIRKYNSRKGSKQYRWGYNEIMSFYRELVMPSNIHQRIYSYKKATPELISKVKKLRERGMSYRDIGKEVGVSHKTARLWCRYS